MKMIDFLVSDLIKKTREKSANPGGGAIVTFIGNLAINLCLMMDKKDYGDLNKEANENRQALMEISKKLEILMQDDIDKVSELIDSYKEKRNKEEIQNKTVEAIKPPEETINLMLKSFDIIEFFLINGKKDTLSDGEIANRLIRESIYSSIINIEINQKYVDYNFDKENIIFMCEEKFNRNQRIIERRK